jgi:hypothetical protein
LKIGTMEATAGTRTMAIEMVTGVGAGPQARPKVLLVEDEALIAINLQAVVQEIGGDVLGPCATTADAMALLAACRPDAALLDYRLADGLARPVAEAMAAAGVPFAVITSWGRRRWPTPAWPPRRSWPIPTRSTRSGRR